jgi:predicted transcriptional regulator
MNLRQARKKKEISQWKLAFISGVHQSRISLAENGLYVPNQAETEKLCEALKINSRAIQWSEQEVNSI